MLGNFSFGDYLKKKQLIMPGSSLPMFSVCRQINFTLLFMKKMTRLFVSGMKELVCLCPEFSVLAKG